MPSHHVSEASSVKYLAPPSLPQTPLRCPGPNTEHTHPRTGRTMFPLLLHPPLQACCLTCWVHLVGRRDAGIREVNVGLHGPCLWGPLCVITSFCDSQEGALPGRSVGGVAGVHPLTGMGRHPGSDEWTPGKEMPAGLPPTSAPCCPIGGLFWPCPQPW